MSVKIYNGFRFKDTDFWSVHRHIMEWRAELRLLQLRASESFVAEMASVAIDEERITPGVNSGTSPFMKAMGLLWDMQAEVRNTGRRNPLVDFEFTLSLMPVEGRIYGIVYTEQQDWLRLWMEKPFVGEYAYWDNVDPPEGVGDAEWTERGRIWNAILSQSPTSAPSMAGFSADCTHDSLFPKAEGVVDAIPAFEQRVARRAKYLVTARRRGRVPESAPGSWGRDVARWLQSEEGQAEFEAEKLRLEGLLDREITKKMLVDPL